MFFVKFKFWMFSAFIWYTYWPCRWKKGKVLKVLHKASRFSWSNYATLAHPWSLSKMLNFLMKTLIFQELLTKHKMLAADFLEANFDKVFGHYQKLLHSDNYVTRRQSLKLLGELLLDRHNFSVRLAIFPIQTTWS